MNCQMIRVISSPSSSTTVPSTLILVTSGGSSQKFGSEVGDVGLLGAHGLGRLAQTRQLALGQVALDDPLDAVPADLGLDAEVDTGDAVLAVHPRADRHDGAGVLH